MGAEKRTYEEEIEFFLANAKAEGKADFGSTAEADAFVQPLLPPGVDATVTVTHKGTDGTLMLGAKAWVYRRGGKWFISIRPEEAFKDVALHEIAHVYDIEKNGYPSGHEGDIIDLKQTWAHGPTFQEELRRLQQAHGASLDARFAAIDRTFSDQGKDGNNTHLTYGEYGTVPTALLATMPGQMGEVPGEHRNKRGQVWEDFKADIALNGMQYGIFATAKQYERAGGMGRVYLVEPLGAVTKHPSLAGGTRFGTDRARVVAEVDPETGEPLDDIGPFQIGASKTAAQAPAALVVSLLSDGVPRSWDQIREETGLDASEMIEAMYESGAEVGTYGSPASGYQKLWRLPSTTASTAGTGYKQTTIDGIDYLLDVAGDRVTAFEYGSDRAIGQLTLVTSDVDDALEVDFIFVDPPWQRRGIATNMLAFAREVLGPIRHSEVLTEDGEAWSQVVGSVRYYDMEDDTDESCYANAGFLAGDIPGARYAEGWARNPAEGSEWANHAWVVLPNGDILDPTWTDADDSFEYREVRDNGGATGDNRYYELTNGPSVEKVGSLDAEFAKAELSRTRGDSESVIPFEGKLATLDQRFVSLFAPSTDGGAWSQRVGSAADALHFEGPWQRNGVATKMLEIARSLVDYPLEHDSALTDDGRAWSRVVGTKSLDIVVTESWEDDGWGEDDLQHQWFLEAVEDGVRVGTMLVVEQDDGTPMVDEVAVDVAHRRKGVATRLWEKAKSSLPGLQHSWWQTSDGRAWSQSVGGERFGEPSSWRNSSLEVHAARKRTATLDQRFASLVTAGPGSGVIPERVRAEPPANPYAPRPILVERVAEGDIRDLPDGEEKAVRRLIGDIGRGKVELERKQRPPLGDCFSADAGYSLRVLLYLHVDGSWRVFYVGHHDYGEAERRMAHLAARVEPLPMGPGIFYRLQGERPFEAAPTSTVSREHITYEEAERSFGKDHAQRYFTPREGYSAFANPLHILQYVEEMNWDEGKVVVFRGTIVGSGFDDEPLVKPSGSSPIEIIEWEDFTLRLEVTDCWGYGRWDDSDGGGGRDYEVPGEGPRYFSLGGLSLDNHISHLMRATKDWTQDRHGPPAMTVEEAKAHGYTDGPWYHSTDHAGSIMASGFFTKGAEDWEVDDYGSIEEFEKFESVHQVWLAKDPSDVDGYGSEVLVVYARPAGLRDGNTMTLAGGAYAPDPSDVVPVGYLDKASGKIAASGRRGITLEIDYDPADGWSASAEGYAATHQPIPLSRVRKIGSKKASGSVFSTARTPDTPISQYGFSFDPQAAASPEVARARAWDGWDTLPVVQVPLGSLVAIEDTVCSGSISDVVSGGEPFREGYDIRVLRLGGRLIIVDGHHRACMHSAMGHATVAARVLDLDDLDARFAKVAMDLGIRVEDLQRSGDNGVSGRVSDLNSAVIGWRGFGSWDEARQALKRGSWSSGGTFVVDSHEGRTQFAGTAQEILNGSGLHTLRGSGFVGMVAIDLRGLPFRSLMGPWTPGNNRATKPSQSRSRQQWQVDPASPTSGIYYPDLSQGLGIEVPIPWDRVRMICEIKDKAVVSTMTPAEFAKAADSLQNNPQWVPEVKGDWATKRLWTYRKGSGQVHVNAHQTDRAWCGAKVGYGSGMEKGARTPISRLLAGEIWDWGGAPSKARLCPKCEGKISDRSSGNRAQMEERRYEQSSRAYASKAVLYHGTDAELDEGEVLTSIHGDEPHTGVVWMSVDQGYAASHGKHLYEVEPIGPVYEHHDSPARTSGGARVVRRLSNRATLDARFASMVAQGKVGDPGYLSRTDFEALYAQVAEKVRKAPIPAPGQAERNRDMMERSRRPGGDFRGNSYDRRRRSLSLLAEFGDGTTCGCWNCGKILDASTLEEDKIFTGAQGGRYTLANLLPICRDCNAMRSDRSIARAASGPR